MDASDPDANVVEPMLSKRGLGWAGLAASVACAACCALPMIAVFAGGVGASVMAIVTLGAELIAGGVAGVATLAFFAVRSRVKARSCASACRVDASCCEGGPAQERTP
jgi:hypothetical protein